jgi:hypothetical protein
MISSEFYFYFYFWGQHGLLLIPLGPPLWVRPEKFPHSPQTILSSLIM